MALYWLVPVDGEDPLVLGGDRELLQGGPELEAFRQKLHRDIHARLLPLVKAAILPGDSHGPEEELASGSCGSDRDGPSFADPGTISFDGYPYGLSECGRAFIDRLPLLREQEEWLNRAQTASADGGYTEQEHKWLQFISAYVRSGRKVMLVKEE